MKSRFLTGLILGMLLLGVGKENFAEAQTITAADKFLEALNDPDRTEINLGGSINTRILEDSEPIGFTPDPIERVITITSSGTITISYGTTAQTAEEDGVDYYFTIVDGGGITFSKEAKLSGGFGDTLFRIDSGKLTFDKTATFEKNSGAIYAQSSSTLTFNGDAIFTSNSIEGDGGAIGLLDATITIKGDATFTSNTAQANGGALYLTNDSTLLISGNSTFSKNSTLNMGDGGGAIYAAGGTLTFGG
ncbi:MAG: hypothetical protein LBC02_10890, partial [Planctomycetaceae bacterium]|nr:hypothetical protein [Planctomycetaceae bacterium]